MIHLQNPPDWLPCLDALTCPCLSLFFEQSVAQSFVQNIFEKGRFAGARNTGYADQGLQGKLDVDLFEVVFSCALDFDAGKGVIWPEA